MRFSTKRINNKDYLYGTDSVYISKGKTIKKNKSFGPVELVKNINQKKIEFRNYITTEEIRLRIDYWSKHISNKKFLKYIWIEKIEKFRTNLNKIKENIGDIGTLGLETAFLVDFIFNSNKIEGSKIPISSVERIVRKSSLKKNSEVENTIKAIRHSNMNFKFNLLHIEKIHSILMSHEPSNIKYRRERVVVGDMDTCDWQKIKIELKKLLDWLKKNNGTLYPPELAFEFYLRFELIHPFVDGNGRIGRILMNKILKDNKYHPIIIWNKRRQSHLNVFKRAINGQEENYYKFMEEQMIKTYKYYLEKTKKAFDIEEQMKYFLKPSE